MDLKDHPPSPKPCRGLGYLPLDATTQLHGALLQTATTAGMTEQGWTPGQTVVLCTHPIQVIN